MTPAGWYNDPDGSGQLRWWDGNAWTQYVESPAQTQPVQTYQPQPLQPPGFPAPASQTQSYQAQPYQPHQPTHPGGGSTQFAAIGTIIQGSQSPARSPLFVLVWIGIVGMAVGPFLDWMTIDGGDGSSTTSIKGNKSVAETWLIGSVPDGYIMLGLAALVVVAAIVFNTSDSRNAAGWSAFLGLAGIGLAAASYFHFRTKFDDLVDAAGRGASNASLYPAIGFWIGAVGAILVVAGGLASKAGAATVTRAQPPFGANQW